MKLTDIREKFWIRKDRENFFFTGLMIACIGASFTSTYWNYTDMTEVKPKIKLNTGLTKEKQYKVLREADYLAPKLSEGNTTFYKLEKFDKPAALPNMGAQ